MEENRGNVLLLLADSNKVTFFIFSIVSCRVYHDEKTLSTWKNLDSSSTQHYIGLTLLSYPFHIPTFLARKLVIIFRNYVFMVLCYVKISVTRCNQNILL